MAYHYRIVHGSVKNFQEKVIIERKDKNERFCQQHVVVAVACLCSMTSDVLDWKPKKIDEILIEGDFTFFCIESDLTDNGIKISSKTIARSIQLGFKGKKNMIEFVCDKSFFGTFGSMLNKFRKYMELTANGSRRVLFKSKRVCFGIFDFFADDMSVQFCLFDPNGRCDNGFYDYDGKPCILLFKRIENLFALLERDDLMNHTTVECIPIRKVAIPARLDKTLYFPFRLQYIGDETADAQEQERDADSDEPGTTVGESDAKNVGEKIRTRFGRTVEEPNRYVCEPHPSFWRGKERQDAERVRRNKVNFVASKTDRYFRIYNSWRRLRYKLKHP